MKTNINRLILSESTTLKKAASVMDQAGVKIVLVCEANGKLKGVLSFGDLRRALLGGVSSDEKINKVYNINPITSTKGDTAKEIKSLAVSKLETAGGFIQVPIVNKLGKPVDVAIFDLSGNVRYFSESNPKDQRVEKILITGGAGYLGSTLVHRLITNGYKVKVLDNLTFGKDSISKIWAHSNFDLVVGDVLHVDDVVEAAKDVDAVVHLAAIVGDEASREDPIKSIMSNTLATINIANVCKKFQINRMVFTSTCSVYGANETSKLLDEKSRLAPVSLYAQSKIESEIELLKLTDTNFSPTILRLSTLFGWSYRPRFDLVVNLFALLASRKKEINVYGGAQWRPFLHVKDAARAIEEVIQAPIDKVRGEVFNVGSENSNYRIKEIAGIIKKMLPNTVVNELEEVNDQRDYKVSFKKIHKFLNYSTEISLEKGIAEILKNLDNYDINRLKKNAFNSPGSMSVL